MGGWEVALKLHCTNFCWDCIDRNIVNALQIKMAVSNLENGEWEDHRIMELLRERRRQSEEQEKMTGEKI